MKKSLFKRVFRLTVGLTFVSFIILGITLSIFFGRFWVQEKYALLDSNAASLSAQISLVYNDNEFAGESTERRYAYTRALSHVTAASVSGRVVVVTDEGEVYACSSDENWDCTGRSVSIKTVEDTFFDEYRKTGDLDGLLGETCFISGVPILSGETAVGAVYICSPVAHINQYIVRLICIFCICSSIIIIIICLGVYAMTNSMVRPLRAMSDAAKCMANGDFSRRIKVDREDEIGELAEAFNNMTSSIEGAERSRRGFAANVSHELRTPMTIISGFIDGILDGTIPKEDEEKYLRIISDEVRRLSRLVGTMLNLSKLEEGSFKPNIKSFDLTETVVQVVIAFENRIVEKQLEIRGLDSLTRLQLRADPDLMYQAVFNLVENAIKFTNTNGYIEFGYDYNGRGVGIKFRNSGEGIPAESLPHIFERFYKTDKSRSSDKNGAGLGLNLVKTIVSLHGGTITVRSVEGEYSEFEIYLNCIESVGEEKDE